MSHSASLSGDDQSSPPGEVSNSDAGDDEQKVDEEEEEDEVEEVEVDEEEEDEVEVKEEEEDEVEVKEEEEDDEVEEVEDDDNEEEEEEEVEVKEEEEDDEVEEVEDDDNEEEQEEEEEEEDDDDNEEVEEDEVSDSPIEANDDHKDVRQDEKCERNDGQLGSASSNQGNSKDLLPNALVVEERSSNFNLSDYSKELLAMENEELGVESGKHLAFSENRGSRELMVGKDTAAVPRKNLQPYSKQCSNSFSSGNSVIMDAKTTNSSGVTQKKEVVDVTMMSEVSGRESHGDLYSEEVNKHKDLQSGNDKKRKASRMDVPEIGTKSLSSSVENKDAAIICDFFLKGWCIRGISCRFLHIKDHIDTTHPQCKGDVSVENCEKELHFGEGLRDTNEKSGSPSLHISQSPSFGNRSGFSSDRIKSRELMEGETSYHHLHQRKELYVDTSPAIKDVGRASKHQSWPTNNSSSPSLVRGDSALRKSLHPELSSSGYTISSSNYDVQNLSSYSSHDKDAVSIQRHHMHDYQNSSLNRSLLTTGMVSSNHISTWTSSQPFSYSPFNSYSLASRSSSFMRSSSFSGPEPDNLPSTSSSLHSAELKAKVSNNWEPSVPFRPSFCIQSVIPSPGSQYDPLRDSFEMPRLGNVSSKASLFCQGSSIVNSSNPQMHGDSNTGILGLACSDDTNSVSSHNTYHEKTMPKEENPLGPSDVKDIAKKRKINGYIDSRYHCDGSRFGNDLSRENNEMIVECDMDGGVQQESKALRHFRGALVELVKDLLKPKWREGQLSKDSYKNIVKKAVDKILSASEPHQIPTTLEALNQFICSSRQKIAKLVEGYADKYGKNLRC